MWNINSNEIYLRRESGLEVIIQPFFSLQPEIQCRKLIKNVACAKSYFVIFYDQKSLGGDEKLISNISEIKNLFFASRKNKSIKLLNQCPQGMWR
jgi:hypothetical protein